MNGGDLARIERVRRFHESLGWSSGPGAQAPADASAILELRLSEVALRLKERGAREDWSLPAAMIAIRHDLQDHFEFEEAEAEGLFRKYGGADFVEPWRRSHQELLSRLDQLRQRVADLVGHPERSEAGVVMAFGELIAMLKSHAQREEEVLNRAEASLRGQAG